MSRYGAAPSFVMSMPDITLQEVMYYLYLPVGMPEQLDLRFPQNVESCRPLVEEAIDWAIGSGRDIGYDYVYLSARKGWATPDNPLNRPGWHCDGFGTDDLNFVWWDGAGTRFLIGDLGEVPEDHKESMKHFELLGGSLKTVYAAPYKTQGKRDIEHGIQHCLYALDPYVVHATPIITMPAMRTYIKVSLSKHQYNLENNSHNYLFDYSWALHSRETIRNDTFKAQRDYA